MDFFVAGSPFEGRVMEEIWRRICVNRWKNGYTEGEVCATTKIKKAP